MADGPLSSFFVRKTLSLPTCKLRFLNHLYMPRHDPRETRSVMVPITYSLQTGQLCRSPSKNPRHTRQMQDPLRQRICITNAGLLGATAGRGAQWRTLSCRLEFAAAREEARITWSPLTNWRAAAGRNRMACAVTASGFQRLGSQSEALSLKKQGGRLYTPLHKRDADDQALGARSLLLYGAMPLAGLCNSL